MVLLIKKTWKTHTSLWEEQIYVMRRSGACCLRYSKNVLVMHDFWKQNGQLPLFLSNYKRTLTHRSTCWMQSVRTPTISLLTMSSVLSQVIKYDWLPVNAAVIICVATETRATVSLMLWLQEWDRLKNTAGPMEMSLSEHIYCLCTLFKIWGQVLITVL